MAVIINTDSTIEINFSIKKSERKEWFNYRIETYLVNKITREKTLLRHLSLLEEENLYFDAYYEPEIPIFMEGLQQVLENRSDFFSFTPIDDKDFVLELKKVDSTQKFLLSFYIVKDIPNVWDGIRIIVDKNALSYFIDCINQEINQII